GSVGGSPGRTSNCEFPNIPKPALSKPLARGRCRPALDEDIEVNGRSFRGVMTGRHASDRGPGNVTQRIRQIRPLFHRCTPTQEFWTGARSRLLPPAGNVEDLRADLPDVDHSA